MNLRPHTQPTLEINLTPLIDVVFLLLIFFMVSTTFQRETRIEIELPEATAAQDQVLPDDKLEIVIDQEGNFFINDRAVVDTQAITLFRAVSRFVGDNHEMPVMIRADGKAPYQAVVTVMDVLSQLGMNEMSFAATRAPELAE